MKIILSDRAKADYLFWAQQDKKILNKIDALFDNIVETPYSGLGKPEPLKHDLSGFWSRRINKEYRLVYEVRDNAIFILQCRYHY